MSRPMPTFQPSSQAYLQNPHPSLALLREDHPVCFWEAGRAWLISRHADIAAVLTDPRFTVNPRAWRDYPGHDPDFYPPAVKRLFEHGLGGLSDKDHARVRKVVSPSFRPRAVARMSAQVQAVVDAALADLPDDGSTFDLVTRFADAVPMRVIGDLLGIPPSMRDGFHDWGSALIQFAYPTLTRDEQRALFPRLLSGIDALHALIETRRKAPADGLLSDLIHAEEEGARISREELLSLVAALITAGSETTVHLITYATYTLLSRPAVEARVREDWSLLPGTLEEVLRHDGFGRIGIARFAKEDVELDGHLIQRGDMLHLLINGSGRDPEMWGPDADTFDIDRSHLGSLSFGRGERFCLGVHLARLEGRLAVRSLLERYPTLKLAAPPTYSAHPLIRKMDALYVRSSGWAHAITC